MTHPELSEAEIAELLLAYRDAKDMGNAADGDNPYTNEEVEIECFEITGIIQAILTARGIVPPGEAG